MLKLIMKAINLSALAYSEPEDIKNTLDGIAFDFEWIENNDTDTQCFIYEDETQTWVVFRGTEFDNFDDWITNLDCRFNYDSPWGAMHNGFYLDMYSVMREIDDHLSKNIISGKPIKITGHSQGASVAEQYFANRKYFYPDEDSECIAIAPARNMTKNAAFRFGQLHGSIVHTVINNNDIVTRVPTRFMGFGHIQYDDLNYLDEDGNLHHNLVWWKKFLDRVKGRVYDFGKIGTDGLKDHPISEYKRIWSKLL